MSFAELISEHNGLPLNSRSVDEILFDYEIETRFTESYERSVLRREVPRFKSQFVIEYLNELDAYTGKLGELSMQYIHFISATENY